MRVTRNIALAAGTVLTVVGVGVGMAMADPGTTPPENSLVAVGSDTITPLFNKFSTDYVPAPGNLPLYSFDATGSSTITSKVVPTASPTPTANPCANLNRPNGSSQGITAVAGSLALSNGTHCEDLARASRQLNANDPTSMAQVVIAQDLISYSVVPSSNVPTNLTPTQLKAIFNCNAALLGGGATGPVTENEIGGVGTDVVVPVIPQTGSGTRSSWASMQGFSNSNPPSCITNGTYNGSGIEENEGTNAIFTSSFAKDIVWPFSGGDWACYTNAVNSSCSVFNTGSLVFGNVNGIAPVTGTKPNVTINTAHFFSSYLRNLNVDFIKTASSPFIPSNLQPLLGNDTLPGKGWICSNATAQADIKSFGFATTSSCGLVSFG